MCVCQQNKLLMKLLYWGVDFSVVEGKINLLFTNKQTQTLTIEKKCCFLTVMISGSLKVFKQRLKDHFEEQSRKESNI